MAKNGADHRDGSCDNCSAVGPLGWIVGGPPPTRGHRHSCAKTECRDALKRLLWEKEQKPRGRTPRPANR